MPIHAQSPSRQIYFFNEAFGYEGNQAHLAGSMVSYLEDIGSAGLYQPDHRAQRLPSQVLNPQAYEVVPQITANTRFDRLGTRHRNFSAA